MSPTMPGSDAYRLLFEAYRYKKARVSLWRALHVWEVEEDRDDNFGPRVRRFEKEQAARDCLLSLRIRNASTKERAEIREQVKIAREERRKERLHSQTVATENYASNDLYGAF